MKKTEFTAELIISIKQFYRKLDRKKKIKNIFNNGRKNRQNNKS